MSTGLVTLPLLRSTLSRAVTYNGGWNSPHLDDDLRVLALTQPTFLGRVAYVWYPTGEDEAHFKAARERLRGILQARGIEGLVILGTPTWVESIDFDLGRFACATIGYSVRMPIHRSSPHQYEELLQALRRLEQLGYRRPGLILSENSDRRTLQHYSSAFLRWQWGRARDQLVPLEVQPQLGYDEFKRWFTAGRPDVVIAQAPEAPIYLEWLRKLGRPAPARCGFVSLDVDPTLDFVCSGIRQNCEMAAAAAVDLVVAQIQRRERGLPTLPKVVLIEGTWVDGVTTRAQ